MNRVKRWLVERYLPPYARQSMLEQEERLRAENQRLLEECRALRAYAEGLEYALTARGSHTIYLQGTGGAAGGGDPSAV